MGLFGASVALGTESAAAEQAPACATWEIEYALVGTLRLTDTPFGRADGAHKIGPGKMVLRYTNDRVSMLSYSMRQPVHVEVSAFFSKIEMDALTTTRASPDSCGIAAEGVLRGQQISWASNVRGLLTEGSLTCTGKLCGKYGAPPPGTRPIKIGPHDTRVRPFELSKDGRTFVMPFTFAVKTESPKQTSFLALTGHEVKRTCVSPPPPCRR